MNKHFERVLLYLFLLLTLTACENNENSDIQESTLQTTSVEESVVDIAPQRTTTKTESTPLDTVTKDGIPIKSTSGYSEEQKAEILEAYEALKTFYDKYLNVNYPGGSQYITSIDDVRYADDLYSHYDPKTMSFTPEEEIEFWVTCADNEILSSSHKNEWCLVSKIDGEWTTYTEYMSR